MRAERRSPRSSHSRRRFDLCFCPWLPPGRCPQGTYRKPRSPCLASRSVLRALRVKMLALLASCPGNFVGSPLCPIHLRACPDFQAQRRFQTKLWEADRRLTLSAVHQRRARPFVSLEWPVARAFFDRRSLVGTARSAMVARRIGKRRAAGGPLSFRFDASSLS
jgi:hypothetical protein